MTADEAARAIRDFKERGHPGYVRFNFGTGGVIVSVEVVPAPFRIAQNGTDTEIIDTVLKTR